MSKRTDMLASTVRSLIAPALRDVPPECGVATITAVEMSPDTSYVTAYISALKEPELALEFLEGKRSELQKRLGALGRARMPILRFRIDDTSQRAERVERLLDQDS